MLTPGQRASFAAEGLLKIPAALDPDRARRMCADVWAFLAAQQGIRRDVPATWTTARPSGFNRLSRTGALDRMWSPALDSALTELLDTDEQQRERPRVLLTFPEPDQEWDVPSSAWHFDFTPLQEQGGLRAVQVFALLSDVRPRGGGTVVLSGSHQLVSRYVARTGQEPKPRLVRGDLGAAHSWLAELWGGRRSEAAASDSRAARLLGIPTVVDGVDLCVTEVTGDAGDVYIMNPDCFHAAAPNALSVPRVMCTSLVIRALPASAREPSVG